MIPLPEIASAWVALTVTTKGMEADVRRELNKIDGTSAGRKIGQQLSSGAAAGTNLQGMEAKLAAAGHRGAAAFGNALKVGALAAAAGVATAVGATLVAGLNRLKQIDDARFTLKALGNDAATVSKIMDSALKAVKGTAFAMGDAADVAASAIAADVPAGEGLTKYLSEVADLAAVTHRPLSDVGAIFNKIQTTNKVYLEDLQQLPQIPIFKWLQEEYRKTADEMSKMVSDGDVDAAHFQEVIQKHIGGAALTMGESFSGAVDNAQAAVARLGANFLTAIFGGDSVNALDGPTKAVQVLTGKFDEMSAWVTANGPQIHQWFAEVGNDVRVVAGVLGDVLGWLVRNKEVAYAFAAVFVGWKVASALGEAAVAAKGLATALGLIGPASASATSAVATFATGAIASIGALAAAIAGAAIAFEQLVPKTMTTAERDKMAGRRGMMPDLLPNNAGVNDPIPVGVPNRVIPGRAGGGPVLGAGGPMSDVIPIWASNGEHVLSARDVQALGGQSGVYRFRNALKRAQGGAVTIDALKMYASGMSGGKYVLGGPPGLSGTDCSGGQSSIANFITGGTGRFATGNEAEALLSRGFTLGDPPPGVAAYWVGWTNGGPAGGHTAGTIIDPRGGNVNVEMGGASGGGAYGGPAAGASGLPNRAWIAVAGGEDPNTPTNFSPATAPPSDSGGSPGANSAAGGVDGQSLGQSIIAGMMQSVGLDGSVFSNPMEWPNVKSAMAAINWGGGLLKGMGGPLDPNTTTHGQGGGQAPGPSVVVNGNVGMDPRGFTQRVDAAQNQSWRRNMSAVRP